MSAAIREALEPFAKALEEASIGTPDTVSLWFHPSAMGLTVGDLRRARTAYDAIGSGVKALKWSETSDSQYRSFDFASAQCATGFGGYYRIEERLNGRFDVWFPNEGTGQPFATEAEAKAAAQADYERRVLSCLSPVVVEEADAKAVAPKITAAMVNAFYEATEVTREGSIRNTKEGLAAAISCLPTNTAARAGPVGEAVAWREFVLSRIKALGEGDQYGLKSFAIAELQSILDHVARPVEEPGEVERDEAPQTDGGFLTRGERAAIDKLGEATALRRELAETRERLEKVEAVAAENGRAGVEAAARYVEALWNAHTKEFGIYDPSTNATEFSGASEDIDCLYQELIEGIRSLDTARVDRARAAFTGDAEVGR